MISHPLLWSFIDGSRPGFIPCLLDRSKHNQLDAHIVSRRVGEVVAYINPHIDRLRSLHLELGPVGGNQFAALRALKTAPKLRRLIIECRGVLAPENIRFTPGIIEPIASLHHLRLSGFPITPQLVQLRNLTFVDLDVSRATLRALLDLLSRNPLLKVIRLWGQRLENFNGDSTHPPGSVHLPHLEALCSEMTPLVHLNALSPPDGARVFSGFVRGVPSNYARGSYTAAFPIPVSFSNLQGLRKLRLVDQGEIYVKLEGEKGSVTYCMSRERPFSAGTFSGVPLEEVRDAIYEISPLLWNQPQVGPTTSQLMVSRIVCGMTLLQKLELSFFGVEQGDYFLLVLHSQNACRYLKFLVLSHCMEPHRPMRNLITMAEGRKEAGVGLDAIRIVHSNVELLKASFKQEGVTRLERAVGTLEFVRAEQGRSGKSSLRFDPELGIEQPYIFF